MLLPEHVMALIRLLEAHGFEAWAVGGCVRDAFLGNPAHDFDLCTSALPEQTQEVFRSHRLVLAGLKHGTVGVVTEEGVVEITTFRTEGDYTDSRHPGWVKFVPTIDEDLARRDFTINAMAYSPIRGDRDPFGGREDLKNNVLRCVGDPEQRFREDALRILRGARFAARFGMEIETQTWNAMLSTAPLMEGLARERVFEELCRLLCLTDGKTLCRLAPILARVIPELEPMIGFDQRSPHHAHDVFTHTALVVEGVPAEPELRLAALLHDVGKPGCFTTDETGRGHFYGHAQLSAQMAQQILRDLKAPTALREEVVWLIDHHMSFSQPTRKSVRRLLSRYGKERLMKLNALHRADLLAKDAEPVARELAQLQQIRDLIQQVEEEEGRMTLRDLKVNGRDLAAAGIPQNAHMGMILQTLFNAVLGEEVANEREPLLEMAKDIWNQVADESESRSTPPCKPGGEESRKKEKN